MIIQQIRVAKLVILRIKLVAQNAGETSMTTLALFPGSLHERPLNCNGLAQDVITIQLLFGCQSLLVGLVLHKGVTLQETCPSVQVQVNVLDLAILGELVMDVVLLSLLVDPRHEKNPSLDPM